MIWWAQNISLQGVAGKCQRKRDIAGKRGGLRLRSAMPHFAQADNPKLSAGLAMAASVHRRMARLRSSTVSNAEHISFARW